MRQDPASEQSHLVYLRLEWRLGTVLVIACLMWLRLGKLAQLLAVVLAAESGFVLVLAVVVAVDLTAGLDAQLAVLVGVLVSSVHVAQSPLLIDWGTIIAVPSSLSKHRLLIHQIPLPVMGL